LSVNTPEKVTRSSLIALSNLIAKHIEKTPPAVLRLFRFVVDARAAAHAKFKRFGALSDDQMQRSNAAHKSFIDTLTTAFESLGGRLWEESETVGAENKQPELSSDGKEDLDRLVPANKFSILDLEEPNVDGDEGEASADSNPLNSRGQGIKKGKKKSKHGKKAKGHRKDANAPQSAQPEVSIESYQLVLDEDGIQSEYWMAVVELAKEWTYLRQRLQAVWKRVARNDLNSAAAGCLSRMAITMIRRTEASIFLNFPGHESYETAANTLLRGGADKMQCCITTN